MEIRFDYDAQANFVNYTVEGLLDVEKLSITINQAMELVDLGRSYFDLWDLRAIELSDNVSELIWAMAEITRQRASTKRRPAGKTALVADSAHIYGLGRMYEQMLHEDVYWEQQVFDDLGQAIGWLFQ